VRKKEPKKGYKDSELNKLKKRIYKLEKENHRLKSDLNAYEQAFRKTSRFLRDSLDEISLEDLIEAAKSDKSLKEVKEIEEEKVEVRCPICFSDTKVIPMKDDKEVVICNSCSYRTTRSK